MREIGIVPRKVLDMCRRVIFMQENGKTYMMGRVNQSWFCLNSSEQCTNLLKLEDLFAKCRVNVYKNRNWGLQAYVL